MTENEQAPGYEPRVAPPTQPNTTPRPPRTSGWPNVVGTIAIVFGALGTLGGVWAIVAPVFVERMTSLVPGQEASMALMKNWPGWLLVNALAVIVTAAILLAGGIGLVKRARWGVIATRIWVFVKIALVATSAGLGYAMQQDTLRAMPQQGFPMSGESLTFVGLAFSVLWGWTLPVFMLIWFGRERIRNEVAGWNGRRSPEGRTIE